MMERIKKALWPNPFYCKKITDKGEVASHSNYLEPLEGEGLRGKSRDWGDATIEVQHQAIVILTCILRAERFSEEDIAFALCLVRIESGFNPDAAAKSSSASGLGQFINQTRKNLATRLKMGEAADRYKFNAVFNALLLVPHLKECFSYANKALGQNRYVMAYEYHHDGPTGGRGGANLAKEEILPRLKLAKEFL